jgi:hypothetical protein
MPGRPTPVREIGNQLGRESGTRNESIISFEDLLYRLGMRDRDWIRNAQILAWQEGSRGTGARCLLMTE